jgi:hypothetical protein
LYLYGSPLTQNPELKGRYADIFFLADVVFDSIETDTCFDLLKNKAISVSGTSNPK